MYTFTQDQLYQLLKGTCELQAEYEARHGKADEAAIAAAALDMIEGLDAERELIAQGEQITPTHRYTEEIS